MLETFFELLNQTRVAEHRLFPWFSLHGFPFQDDTFEALLKDSKIHM